MLDADRIVRSLQGAFSRGVSREELLQLAAVKIREVGDPYSGVYMYMLHPESDLVLEAFAGRPTDLTRIPVGTGICWQAVAERRDINVPDVSAAEGYLSCSVETKSELVVLIRRHDDILGQIDIDSDLLDPFDEAEQGALKRVADALAVFL